jgi:hypothetical protein
MNHNCPCGAEPFEPCDCFKEKNKMEEIQIVAMIDRSAGNETVGDMWTETKVFPISASLNEIYEWASKRLGINSRLPVKIEEIKANIKLSVAQ